MRRRGTVVIVPGRAGRKKQRAVLAAEGAGCDVGGRKHDRLDRRPSGIADADAAALPVGAVEESVAVGGHAVGHALVGRNRREQHAPAGPPFGVERVAENAAAHGVGEIRASAIRRERRPVRDDKAPVNALGTGGAYAVKRSGRLDLLGIRNPEPEGSVGSDLAVVEAGAGGGPERCRQRSCDAACGIEAQELRRRHKKHAPVVQAHKAREVFGVPARDHPVIPTLRIEAMHLAAMKIEPQEHAGRRKPQGRLSQTGRGSNVADDPERHCQQPLRVSSIALYWSHTVS